MTPPLTVSRRDGSMVVCGCAAADCPEGESIVAVVSGISICSCSALNTMTNIVHSLSVNGVHILSPSGPNQWQAVGGSISYDVTIGDCTTVTDSFSGNLLFTYQIGGDGGPCSFSINANGFPPSGGTSFVAFASISGGVATFGGCIDGNMGQGGSATVSVL